MGGRAEKPISFGLAQEMFRLDAETGRLFWRERPPKHFSSRQTWLRINTMYAGKIAGSVDNSDGYRRVRGRDLDVRAHRLVWLLFAGEWPAGEIDHINGIRDDNRPVNLRCVTRSENSKNQALHKNNTSGTTGVVWSKKERRWRAQMRLDGKSIVFGYFRTIEQAVQARKSAEKQHGFHPNHGRSAA